MQEVFKLLHEHVRAASEMETTVRVLILLIEVIKQMNNETVELQLQPSVAGHPVFIDLFIIVRTQVCHSFSDDDEDEMAEKEAHTNLFEYIRNDIKRLLLLLP